MFSNKAQIPCVGISFGVDRIFSITKARMERERNYSAVRSTEVDVFVMAFGGKGFTGMLKERMEVAKSLWKAGVKVGDLASAISIYWCQTKKMTNQNYTLQAEFSYKVKPKLPQQFKAAESNGVPFAVILGEEELKAGKVRIKEMGLEEGHPEKEGVLVDLKTLPEEVKARLAKKNNPTTGASGTAVTELAQKVEGLNVEAAPKTEDAGV